MTARGPMQQESPLDALLRTLYERLSDQIAGGARQHASTVGFMPDNPMFVVPDGGRYGDDEEIPEEMPEAFRASMTGPHGPTALPAGGGDMSPVTGELPRQIFAYLVNTHGVTPATAAGILANIQAESNFNPSVFGDGGTSAGLFQHHKGRLTNLQNYAASRGRPWTDWRIQVDFAMREAQQMGLNLAHSDAAQAAWDWTVKFERPANMQQRAAERAAQAQRFLFGDMPSQPSRDLFTQQRESRPTSSPDLPEGPETAGLEVPGAGPGIRPV